MPLNPYEALPGNPLAPGGAQGLTSDGKYVITAVTATWPARCVKCNRGVPSAAYHAKLTWTPRWVIIVFLLSRLIGLILFFMKRRTVNLHVGLCEEHTERRRMHLFVWGGTLGMSVLMGVGGAAMDSGVALVLAGLAFLPASSVSRSPRPCSGCTRWKASRPGCSPATPSCGRSERRSCRRRAGAAGRPDVMPVTRPPSGGPPHAADLRLHPRCHR